MATYLSIVLHAAKTIDVAARVRKMYTERDKMTYLTGLRSAVCTAALLLGTAAHADLTAAEVWEDWKSQLTQYGDDQLSIGAEETSSGTVTVRDIRLTFAEDDVVMETVIGDINFNEQADGSVRVTMADSIPLTLTGEDGLVVTILTTQSNLEMIVSGSPELMEYNVSADSYQIAFQDAVDGSVTITGDAKLTATDMTANYVVAKGETREISANSTIGALDLLVDFMIPGGNGEYITAAAKVNNMRSQSEVTAPLEADFENPETMFTDGFSIAGGYEIENGAYVFDISMEGEQTSGSVSTGSVTFSGELNEQTVAYDTSTRDMDVNLTTSEFPLPITMTMSEYGTGFRMPLGVTEEPADWNFKFDMIDLIVGDDVWNLFDPGNVLPRDPATLQVALSGTARALFDMLDPEATDDMMRTDFPAELNSLTLDNLQINAAGALFTGSGAFTFDNGDMQTFAPLPRPEGDATFEITGLNKLLDNLVAMGVAPEEQVMGPRMMMGMFGRATGDDQMAIDVEVTPNGQVNVNGNRVR